MLEIMTNEAESSAKIIVIGVGGAGNNAVNRMVEAGIKGSDEDALNALMLHPLCGDFAQSKACYEEMKEAHKA